MTNFNENKHFFQQNIRPVILAWAQRNSDIDDATIDMVLAAKITRAFDAAPDDVKTGNASVQEAYARTAFAGPLEIEDILIIDEHSENPIL